MKTPTLLLALLSLSVPALAQRYIHAYGGATVIPSDKNSQQNHISQGHSYIGGGGLELNRGYFGAEGYGLVETLFTNIILKDFDVSSSASGFNLVGGPHIAKTERLAVIPVGILGRTSEKACHESDCVVVLEGIGEQLNYGAGLNTRIMVSRRVGLHVGFRYTRHNGTAFTLGLAFGGW